MTSSSKIVLFDRSEYLARLARTKERMAQLGIDLLLVASPANQFWLTGYDGWSFYTPQMVLVHMNESEPIWFGRKMDAAGARLTVYMGAERILPYPDEYVASTERHAIQYLAGIIRDRGWGALRIGVEMDDYYYTARWHQPSSPASCSTPMPEDASARRIVHGVHNLYGYAKRITPPACPSPAAQSPPGRRCGRGTRRPCGRACRRARSARPASRPARRDSGPSGPARAARWRAAA